ncbi:transcriptional regulator, LytR family protein, partial [Mycobacterium tuberculosis]
STRAQARTPEEPRASGNNRNSGRSGRDARKDQEGNDRPGAGGKQRHAGEADDGGDNTNTRRRGHGGAE